MSWKSMLKFVGMVAVSILVIREVAKRLPDSVPGASYLKSALLA